MSASRGKAVSSKLTMLKSLRGQSHFVTIAARQGYCTFYRHGQENCCVSVTFCDTKEVPSSATGYETPQACSAFVGVGLDIFPRSSYISSVSRTVFIH